MPDRKFSDGDSYRYGFNGKEDDGDWGTQNIQDYGFRLYNPSIAKFLSVDPLSPNFPWYTPYQFAGNMPIWAIDLDGLEQIIVTQWFDNTHFNTEMEIRVESFEGTNVTGNRAVWGSRKNRNSRVEYTLTDQNGNVSRRYAPSLTTAENNVLQSKLGKNLNSKGKVKVGSYKAILKSPLPPPPAPPAPPIPLKLKPRPNTVIPEKNKSQSTQPEKAVPNPEKLKTIIPEPIETVKIQFKGGTNNITKGLSEIDMIHSLLLKDDNLKVTILGNLGLGAARKPSSNAFWSVMGVTDAFVLGSSKKALSQINPDTTIDGEKIPNATFGDLMLGRANKIKSALIKKGINADRINTGTGEVKVGKENRTINFKFNEG